MAEKSILAIAKKNKLPPQELLEFVISNPDRKEKYQYWIANGVHIVENPKGIVKAFDCFVYDQREERICDIFNQMGLASSNFVMLNETTFTVPKMHGWNQERWEIAELICLLRSAGWERNYGEDLNTFHYKK